MEIMSIFFCNFVYQQLQKITTSCPPPSSCVVKSKDFLGWEDLKRNPISCKVGTKSIEYLYRSFTNNRFLGKFNYVHFLKIYNILLQKMDTFILQYFDFL